MADRHFAPSRGDKATAPEDSFATLAIPAENIDLMRWALMGIAGDQMGGFDVSDLTVDDLDEVIDKLTEVRNAVAQLDAIPRSVREHVRLDADRDLVRAAVEDLIDSGAAQMEEEHAEDAARGAYVRGIGLRLRAQLGDAVPA
jgi:hypothetical protein